MSERPRQPAPARSTGADRFGEMASGPFPLLRQGDEKAGTVRVRLLEILQRARRVAQSYVDGRDRMDIDEGLGT